LCADNCCLALLGVDCKDGAAPCNVLGWAKKYHNYNKRAEQLHAGSPGASACTKLGGTMAHKVIRGQHICCPSECGVCGGAHCGYQFKGADGGGSQYQCCPKRILDKRLQPVVPDRCDVYEAKLPCKF
jgi:hypothetical protein